MEPFRRGRFEDLPELPRVPHGWAKTRAEDVEVDSEPFGRMRVHVRRAGRLDAPPLLLVHGLMTTSYSWRYVYEPLAARFSVIAPDLPGCGRTDCVPDRPHSARALATWLGELQRALGIEGCGAVGNSMGGYVCMQRALAAPAAFSRLMVVHAPAFPELRLRALHAAMALPGTRSLLGWLVGRDPERWAHANVHYWDESLKSREEAREYALTSPEKVACFARYLSDTMNPGEMAEFVRALEARGGLGVPLSLVYAEKDPMVPPEIGPRLKALCKDADFVWLKDASHFAHVDAPERVTSLVNEFFV